MCQHTDEDCPDCCFERGKNDMLGGELCDPPYESWAQCNAYCEGYWTVSLKAKEEKK